MVTSRIIWSKSINTYHLNKTYTILHHLQFYTQQIRLSNTILLFSVTQICDCTGLVSGWVKLFISQNSIRWHFKFSLKIHWPFYQIYPHCTFWHIWSHNNHTHKTQNRARSTHLFYLFLDDKVHTNTWLYLDKPLG